MKKYLVISLAFLVTFVVAQGAAVKQKTTNAPTPLTNQPATAIKQPVKATDAKPVKGATQLAKSADVKMVQVTDLNAVRNDLNNFLNQVVVAKDPLQKLQEIAKININPVLAGYFKNLSETYKKILEAKDPKEAAAQLNQYLTDLQQKAKDASAATKAAVQSLQTVTQNALVSKAAELRQQALKFNESGLFDQSKEVVKRAQALIDELSKMAQPVLSALEIYKQFEVIPGVTPTKPGATAKSETAVPIKSSVTPAKAVIAPTKSGAINQK